MTPKARGAPAALGIRTHSGWAALVVLAGPTRSPQVVDRREIELVDRSLRGSEQPYHAAEGLDLAEARDLLKRYSAVARKKAHRGLGDALADARKNGHTVTGCGILLSSGRTGSSLAAILASHALIHTADGNHFRDALAHAAKRLGLPVTGVPERQVAERVAQLLGVGVEGVGMRLSELGRSLGPPWRQDQKLAALVAWLALASAVRT